MRDWDNTIPKPQAQPSQPPIGSCAGQEVDTRYRDFAQAESDRRDEIWRRGKIKVTIIGVVLIVISALNILSILGNGMSILGIAVEAAQIVLAVLFMRGSFKVRKWLAFVTAWDIFRGILGIVSAMGLNKMLGGNAVDSLIFVGAFIGLGIRLFLEYLLIIDKSVDSYCKQ